MYTSCMYQWSDVAFLCSGADEPSDRIKRHASRCFLAPYVRKQDSLRQTCCTWMLVAVEVLKSKTSGDLRCGGGPTCVAQCS